MTEQAATSQQQNLSVLSDAQKSKLTMLSDALKLAPVISEAQSGNLLGGSTFAPFGFTSSSISIASLRHNAVPDRKPDAARGRVGRSDSILVAVNPTGFQAGPAERVVVAPDDCH